MNDMRDTVLNQLTERICAVQRPHPVRVAVDGVDAAGKTIFADQLAPLIKTRGREVIRASIDGFHNPRAIRYRQGAGSPEGYYQDSFDYPALLQTLLIPLGPGGDRGYRTVVFDYKIDAPVSASLQTAPADAILLFDGVFLLRPALVSGWDLSIFLDVCFELSVPRAVERDVTQSQLAPDADILKAQYEGRYVPGQRLYLREANPLTRADIVVDNNDFRNPVIKADRINHQSYER